MSTTLDANSKTTNNFNNPISGFQGRRNVEKNLVIESRQTGRGSTISVDKDTLVNDVSQLSGPRAHLLAGLRSPRMSETMAISSSSVFGSRVARASHAPSPVHRIDSAPSHSLERERKAYIGPHTATLPPRTARNLGLATPLQQSFRPSITTNPIPNPYSPPPTQYSTGDVYDASDSEGERTLYMLEQKKQQLLATNIMLVQQQALLQSMQAQQAMFTPPGTPGSAHASNGQINMSGIYQVYNPAIGGYVYYQQQPQIQLGQTYQQEYGTPQMPRFAVNVTTPPASAGSYSPSPTPLRRGHRNTPSQSARSGTSASPYEGFTGTSPPRERESRKEEKEGAPLRQPKGPPSLELLSGAGSQNFYAMTRRRAVGKITEAGLLRRGASPMLSGTSQSPGPVTSISSDMATLHRAFPELALQK